MRQGKVLRGLGGGWSFSSVAAAPQGILLNTRPLNYRFAVSSIHPQFQGDVSNVFFVQCGMSIAELNEYLRGRGKSLKTSAASNGQTIVGAMSTGTHGSAIDIGAIPDYILGLHIIVAPDRHVWIERRTQPVVADSLVDYLGAELIRNDAIFEAARVSFGSFGLIHGVLLETENLFYLRASRQRMQLDAGLWTAIDALDFDAVQLPGPGNARPYHFAVLINPHHLADRPYITVMHKSTTPPEDCEPPSPGRITPGDDALEVIGILTDRLGAITIEAIAQLLSQVYPEYDAICGTLGEIFTDTTTRGNAISVGMGIPLGHVRRAVELALHTNHEYPFAGLIALRYVKASDATLAFTRYREHTCILEFDGPLSRRTRTYLNRVWHQFDVAGIPYTFHWGKMNNLHAPRVLDMYGTASIEAWRSARQTLLTTPALRRLFANPFLQRVGLDT
jgi:FAD/FMN-containing dehydrogenase